MAAQRPDESDQLRKIFSVHVPLKENFSRSIDGKRAVHGNDVIDGEVKADGQRVVHAEIPSGYDAKPVPRLPKTGNGLPIGVADYSVTAQCSVKICCKYHSRSAAPRIRMKNT